MAEIIQAAGSPEECLSWVKSFVNHSDQHRRQLGLYEIWDEVLTSYLVNPNTGLITGNTSFPLGTMGPKKSRGNPGDATPVAGSETREIVDINTAKKMLALFGGKRDFISAVKRGREDAKAARTVNSLQKYVFGLPNHFLSLNNAVKDETLFGTGVLFGSWCYEEGPVSSYRVDRLGGIESVDKTTINGVIYDDMKIRRLDPVDFYPAVGFDNIPDMPGVARRFTMKPSEALAYARRGKYGFDEAKVKEAISKAPGNTYQANADSFWRKDRVPSEQPHPELKIMTGLEYWGEVPWKNGVWRVITVLNDVVVRDVEWFLPYREIPFYDLRSNTIGGRFWGLSAAEAVRFQQDASNSLLMLMMDGTIRAVHPPIIHDRNDELDKAALRAWRPDALIASDNPGAIKTLTYGANFQQGWNMRGSLQNEMKSNSGATGAVRGDDGPAREAASVGMQRLQYAMDRPEHMVQIYEKECLPRFGKGIHRFCQEFATTTDWLTQRCGEQPEPVALEDIHGEFDIEFIGSRNNQSLQARMAAFDRLLMIAANNMAGVQIPMDQLIVQFLEDNGYDEIAQDVGDPEVIFENMMTQMQLGQGGGGGGMPTAPGAATQIAQQQGAMIPPSMGDQGMVQ